MSHRIIATIACLLLWLPTAALAGEPWTTITAQNNEQLPGNEIQFVEPARGGGVWIGTLSGLAKAQGTELTRKTFVNDRGKPRNLAAWDVLEDGDDLWIGHDRGLIRETTRGGQSQVREYLSGNTVAPIIRLNQQHLFALARDRNSEVSTLYRYNPSEDAWQPAGDLAERRVADLAQTHDGRVWVTIEGDGVMELRPDQPLSEIQRHLEARNVTTLAQDHEDRVWAGLWGGGVQVYRADGWRGHLEEMDAAVLKVVDASGPEGSGIWLATNAVGVYQRQGDSWVNHLRDEGPISLLESTADGRVWVSSQRQGGLRRWDGERFVTSLASPLPIRCVAQAADGTVYAGGVLDGLHVLER